MLNSFMYFGDIKNNSADSIDFETLLFQLLMDFTKFSSNIKLSFRFKFNHKSKIYFNKIQLKRVIINLLINAIETMNNHGEIWIETQELSLKDQNFIQITFGNSNSYIEDQYLDKLFELSFTMGKENGNSIGLYSVKSIINSFGGNIKCLSSKNIGTEFIFTVPKINQLKSNEFSYLLPKNSVNIIEYKNLKMIKNNNTTQSKIIKFINLNFKRMSILILEDCEVYLKSIQSIMYKSMQIYKSDIYFYTANNYHDAVKICDKENPQIIITDIDLKDMLHDGFEFNKYIRKKNDDTYIFVHTNHIFSEERSFELGVILFRYVEKFT
ncbi:hybrid sensor histidine kinase/response regulator [Fluviispira multicolorata]|uniref:Response regulator n=1 Tax=Fluviispira multicolorata TaxID=2654512 RepID=A0A833JCM7_9BACT|nr:hybrid sensor histidine kinase/response regulator [Fluviispira multicolorata]KAB8030856.1 response regulator [Fluviispira multicolorata]